MIQRIQSLYLLFSAIFSVVCLFFVGGGWLSAVLLALSACFGIYTIFQYSNRILQAKLCLFNILLLIGCLILDFVLSLLAEDAKGVEWYNALPLISIIGYVLARRAIMADERLVRAADRIR